MENRSGRRSSLESRGSRYHIEKQKM